MIFEVKIVGKTVPLVQGVHSIPEFIAYMAKVSGNQEDLSTHKKLIAYLIRNKHWSPFEMCHISVEIKAPRDISRQILRHTSAKFQEFSQRYAEVQEYTVRELRAQDLKNRQSSLDTFSEKDKEEFRRDCERIIEDTKWLYGHWIERGAAKECARVFLPEGLTMSKLYMSAPIRTWLHYLDLREGNGTQFEHQEIAKSIHKVLHEAEPDLF